MQAVEDEQHFLLDCPLYSIIRGQHFSLFGPSYQQWYSKFFVTEFLPAWIVTHHIHLIQVT